MEVIIEEKLYRRKLGKIVKVGGFSGQKRKVEMDKNSVG